MKWFSLLPGCALLLGVTHCGTPASEPRVGANTSWYATCDKKADCDDELACWCGKCTAACESDEDCGGGICGNSLDKVGVCPEADATRICLDGDRAECSKAIEEQFEWGEGPVANCVPSALACASFDEALPDSYRVIEEENSQLYWQSCFSFSGNGALTRIGEPADFGHVTIPLTEAVQEGPLHARFFFYLPAETQLPNTAQLLRIHSGPEPEGQVVTLRFRADTSIGVNFFVDAPTEYSDVGVVKPGQWQCVELSLELADAGSAKIAVDGATVLEVSEVDTIDVAAPYDAVRALGATAADGAYFDVAFDELIVAREPIGCE